MTPHKNIHVALAAAQTAMGPVVKGSENPHFRSKYADLSEVVAAVQGPLNANGICFWHKLVPGETRDLMRTVLTHGETDTSIECDVPLIIAKTDMQGFKSATTYAKRIGLESVTGVAPEDDDGNAAAKAAPKYPSSAQMKRDLEALDRELAEVDNDVGLTRLWKAWAKKMNDDNWPVPEHADDETAYRNVVKDRFRSRKEALAHAGDSYPHSGKTYPENILMAGE